jgi:hypothetical protein
MGLNPQPTSPQKTETDPRITDCEQTTSMSSTDHLI